MRRKIYLLTLGSLLFFVGCNSSNKNEATDTIPATMMETHIQSITEEVATQQYIENTSLLDITKEVKDYILTGQEDKPEALKLKWSESFLNNVNIDLLYQEYLINNGITDDIESFAEYITQNAPIPTNWEVLVKENIKNEYGNEITRMESIDGVLYQAYINYEGEEVPYVVVNSRTGYFHG
jgi:hypothetical protein